MMNITTQIETVGRFPDKPWSGRDGATLWFIEGTFKDGRKFSQALREENKAKELHDALTNLIGQEGEYEVEEGNREYKGQREYKLRSYPGKPQYKGGGFGGGRPGGFNSVPRYRDTEQGVKEERDSIHRQVCLKAAVEFLGNAADVGAKEVIENAEAFYRWLCATTKAAPATAPATQAAPVQGAYEKYLAEISLAVKAKDQKRLDSLTNMIQQSLDKGSVNLDQASDLNDELVAAKKALQSSVNFNAWVKQKQSQASANEPRHEDPRMAQTMLEAETVF